MNNERKQNIRVIIIETLMTIAVIAMVIVLTFVAMGYKLSADGTLDQSGLLQVSAKPSSVDVTIDDEEIFSLSNNSKMLTEGEHKVKLSKDGYDTWEKTVLITSGLLYQLDYPRLFKQNRDSEEIKTFEDELEFTSYSDDRSLLLYKYENESVWRIINLVDEKESKIDVSKVFVTDEEDESDEVDVQVKGINWSKNSNKILAKIKKNKDTEYVLVDLDDVDESVNLTEEFDMEFSEAKIASDSGEKIFVIEDGNLRSISVSSKAISRVLVSDVESFTASGDTVFYVTKNEVNKVLGIYVDGEKSGRMIAEYEKDANIKIALSEYLGKKYLSLAIDDQMMIYNGNYPTKSQTLDNMKKIGTFELSFEAKEFYAYNNGRFIVARNGGDWTIFNTELAEFVDLKTSESAFWVDGFLIGEINDGKMTVCDFDGENKREVTDVDNGTTVVISKNNKFLYKFETKDEKLFFIQEEL